MLVPIVLVYRIEYGWSTKFYLGVRSMLAVKGGGNARTKLMINIHLSYHPMGWII